ncbi:MAG: hypothetical protein K0U72_01475 [Gammaproteobacteria bacterium]|nr:hypothetical protein [Gammaproteobacteria bacterium]
MRTLIPFLVLTLFGVLCIWQTSAAQDQLAGRDIGLVISDYVNKAKKCEKTGNSECSAACVEAINLVQNGPSPELEKAAESCNAGFAVIEAEREKKIAEPALRDGYAWMPDIEATVIRARGAPFQIEGRDHDWGKYCTWRVEFAGAANDETSKSLIRSPGTKVILRHVQYPTSRAGTLSCFIGGIEAK